MFIHFFCLFVVALHCEQATHKLILEHYDQLPVYKSGADGVLLHSSLDAPCAVLKLGVRKKQLTDVHC